MSTVRVILFFVPPVTIAAAASGVALAGDSSCDNLMARLHQLESGTSEAKLAWIDTQLQDLGDLADPDEKWQGCRERAMKTLIRFLETEPDDRVVVWMLDRLSDELDDDPAFADYRIEALRDRSPNVRRWIAGSFTDTADARAIPALEELWHQESRPWVRAAVALALAANDDRTLVDEFDAEILSAHSVLADDLLAAIVKLDDPRSVPVLETIAEGSAVERRKQALQALVGRQSLAGVPEALDRLALSSDAAVATAAIDAVADSGEFTTDAGLTEDAPAIDDGPFARGHAVDALLRIGAMATAEGNDAAADAASAAIARLTTPPPQGRAASCTLQVSGGASRELTSPLDLYDDNGYDDDLVVVRPGDGATSVRCRAYPGVVDPASRRVRIPAGAETTIIDSFEWRGVVWYQLALGSEVDCWLSVDNLTADPYNGILAASETDATHETSATESTRDGAARDEEIDLLREELSSRSFHLLEAAGFVKVFDQDEAVVGVRVGMPAGELAPLGTILDAWSETGPELSRAIQRWLGTHPEAWTDRAAIEKLLASSPDD